MDKRRHPRFDGSELYVKLKVDGACHPEALVENVSLGGALVTLADTPAAGKNVLLELRAKQKVLKLTGRVIDVVPRGRGRELPGLRIRFNPTAPSTIADLYALIRDLPAELEVSTDFDIDIEEDEPVLELSDVVDEDATVLVPMQDQLQTKQIRIDELERQLRQLRRNFP